MLVSELIAASMRKLGLISRGEDPTDDEYADGLEALQVMLRFWALKKINVFAESTDTLTLVSGTSTYTWGESGDLTTTKPNRVERAFVRDSENQDHPVKVVSLKEFDEISSKTQSGRPNRVAVSYSEPTGYVYLYPVPNAAETLYLKSIKSFEEEDSFEALDDELAVPKSYELPMIYNLSVQYASEFGVSIPGEVTVIATTSFQDLQVANAGKQFSGVKLNFPAGSSGTYDINAG